MGQQRPKMSLEMECHYQKTFRSKSMCIGATVHNNSFHTSFNSHLVHSALKNSLYILALCHSYKLEEWKDLSSGWG